MKEGLPMNGNDKSFLEKLKPYTKWIITAVIVIAIVAVAITAAVLSDGEDDPLADVAVRINYFANGGEFDNHKSEKTVGYTEGAFPLNIGFQSLTSGNAQMNERAGYEFLGWYLPAKDGNGELIYEDEAKKVVAVGEAFDFTKRLEGDGDIDLYAKWKKLKSISVVLAGDTVTAKDGTVYEPGDIIREFTFKNGTVSSYKGADLLKGDGTFIEYYVDEECTEAAVFPIVDNGEDEQPVIYAKFISGEWTVVTKASEAEKMFNLLSGGKNYYINADIDMDGAEVDVGKLNSNIQGNGHVISNFTVTKNSVGVDGAAMFGAVGSKGKLADLTLSNVTLKVNIKLANDLPNVYFLFTDISDDAEISSLKVSGKLSVSSSGGGTPPNVIAGDQTSWLAGVKPESSSEKLREVLAEIEADVKLEVSK